MELELLSELKLEGGRVVLFDKFLPQFGWIYSLERTRTYIFFYPREPELEEEKRKPSLRNDTSCLIGSARSAAYGLLKKKVNCCRRRALRRILFL